VTPNPQFAILALSLTLLAPSCSGSPKPVPEPVPVPEGGAGGEGGDEVGCTAKSTCTHLKKLGCVASSAVCYQQVLTIQSLGPRASIDLPCLCAAKTQAQVRACESVTCGGVL
jgi:hypothetical protein